MLKTDTYLLEMNVQESALFCLATYRSLDPSIDLEINHYIAENHKQSGVNEINWGGVTKDHAEYMVSLDNTLNWDSPYEYKWKVSAWELMALCLVQYTGIGGGHSVSEIYEPFGGEGWFIKQMDKLFNHKLEGKVSKEDVDVAFDWMNTL